MCDLLHDRLEDVVAGWRREEKRCREQVKRQKDQATRAYWYGIANTYDALANEVAGQLRRHELAGLTS